MSDSIPTVLIKTENGPVLINEADFDPKTMKLADVEAAPAPAPEPAPVAPAAPVTPTQLLVMKSGRKFFIRDSMGQEVTAEGIDKDGYTTEAAALEALAALSA